MRSIKFLLLPPLLLSLACEGPMVEKSDYTLTQDPESSSNDQDDSDAENTEDHDDINQNDNNEDTDIIENENEEEEISSGIEVNTIAGSGEYSSADGAEDTASFADPRLIRVQNDGTLVVADSGSGEIRVVTLDGNVTTLNLSGELPLSLSGLAISHHGTIYVSDDQQHCIFKIEENVSEVYAGTCGVPGNTNGEIEHSLFHQPTGLALKSDGALYVADSANNLIRMIDPKGNVNTIAGTGELLVPPSTGPALEANIYLPFSIALHPSGDIYFSGFDHCIRRIQDGYVEDIAGLCDNRLNAGLVDGPAADARFNTPVDLAFAADESLIIADSFNNRIRRLSSDLTTLSTIAGTTRGFEDGDSKYAQFNTPRSIAIDEYGDIYVGDSKNNRVRVITIE